MASLGYTWYPKDFISDPDVMFMTAAERGVYRDLIDLAYTSDNRITYSIDMLAKYTNSDAETVQKILGLKGLKKEDYWTIPSCDKRIVLANKNRNNGAKGGRPKTQTKPKQNPDKTQSVTNPKTQTERQIEREREIEREMEKKDVVVEETTTLQTTTPRFGICSTHEELKAQLKSAYSWKDLFGKQSGIPKPEDTDRWIDRFVDFAIANGKGDVILKISEAQSYCLHWVTKRIASGDSLDKKPSEGKTGGFRFQEPMGAVDHGR